MLLALVIALAQAPPADHPLHVAERLAQAQGDVAALVVVASALGDRARLEAAGRVAEKRRVGHVLVATAAAQAGWFDLAEAQIKRAPAGMGDAWAALAVAYANAGRGGDSARAAQAIKGSARSAVLAVALAALESKGDSAQVDIALAQTDANHLAGALNAVLDVVMRQPVHVWPARFTALRKASARLPAGAEIAFFTGTATRLVAAGHPSAALRWIQSSAPPVRRAALIQIAEPLARSRPDDPDDLVLSAMWKMLQAMPAKARPTAAVTGPFAKLGRWAVLQRWAPRRDQPKPAAIKTPPVPQRSETLTARLVTKDAEDLLAVAEDAVDAGRFDLARRALQRAVASPSLDPTDERPSLIYADMGDFEAARQHAPDSMAPEDEVAWLADLADRALQAGHEDAVAALAKALQGVSAADIPDIDDCSPLTDTAERDDALRQLAQGAMAEGRTDLTREVIHAMENDYERASALLELVAAQLDAGAVQAALKTADSIGEPVVEDPCVGDRHDLATDAYLQIADHAAGDGRVDVILIVLTRANPEEAAAIEGRIDLLVEPVARRQLLTQLRAAIEKWADEPRAVAELEVAEALIGMGHATAAVDQILRLKAHRTLALAQLGAALWKSGTPLEPDAAAKLAGMR